MLFQWLLNSTMNLKKIQKTQQNRIYWYCNLFVLHYVELLEEGHISQYFTRKTDLTQDIKM